MYLLEGVCERWCNKQTNFENRNFRVYKKVFAETRKERKINRVRKKEELNILILLAIVKVKAFFSKKPFPYIFSFFQKKFGCYFISFSREKSRNKIKN